MQANVSRDQLQNSLPPIEGEFEVDGPEGPIVIQRDAWGIPHVRAQAPADAFFGQGWAAASDRLFQMDCDRMKAMGRWAEIMGEDGFDSDVLMRRMGLAHAARKDFEALKPPTRGMIRAYTAGVNAFLANVDELPVEYRILQVKPERWEPWHCMAVFLVRHVGMGTREMKAFRARLVNALGAERAAALFPAYPAGHPVILPPGAPHEAEEVDAALEAFLAEAENLKWIGDGSDGSNSWLIGGDKTESGSPLLAGDPHRMLEVPNTYWQNHLSTPELEVIGLSFPGVPGFPHFAHNDRVAWCITHTAADNQDLFIERFNNRRYLYRGEWLMPETRWETIRVKGGEDRDIEIVETRNGPVLSGDTEEGYGLSFRWSATSKNNTTFDCFVPMMAARSADDLELATRAWVEPCNNLLFADVEGDYGFRVRGRLPVRPPRAGWIPLPGWTGEGDWRGWVPFEEMPACRDPEQGIFATANNRVVGADYPHYIGVDFRPGYRAGRLFQLLRSRERFAIEDMPWIHSDIVSLAARELCPLLEGITAEDEGLQWARDMLANWTGEMRAGDLQPTVYSTFREILVDEVLTGILGEKKREILCGMPGARIRLQLRGAIVKAISEDDDRLLDPDDSWAQVMARSLERAIEVLKSELGTEESDWRWGNVHRARPKHPLSDKYPDQSHLLDPPERVMAGDADTIQAASYLPGYGFDVVGTAVGRYAFDLSDWNRCGWIVPLGSSGHPGSRHYTDQADSWSEHLLIPMLFDWDEIDGGSEGILTLLPRSDGR